MSKRKMWTEEEISILKELVNLGKSIKEIGNALGRDKQSVNAKMSKMGIKSKYRKKKMIDTYIYNIDEIVGEGTLKIIKQIRYGNKRIKGYLVKSMIYSDAPFYEVSEYNLKNGAKCAYSTTPVQRIFEGNSLYSMKEYRKYLVDIEEAKTIAPNSTKPILVKCPNCGKQRSIKPNKLIRRDFPCLNCSKNSYYPEILFNAVNEYMSLNYLSQQTFDDLPGRIFDFVNYEKRIIVETHGEQHYDKTKKWYKSSVLQDKEKREYCKENNWTFLELDCRKSDFNFIIGNINLNEMLPIINKTDEKAILKIMEKNKRYPIKDMVRLYSNGKTTIEIGEIFNISNSTVGKILRNNNVKMRKGGRRKSI